MNVYYWVLGLLTVDMHYVLTMFFVCWMLSTLSYTADYIVMSFSKLWNPIIIHIIISDNKLSDSSKLLVRNESTLLLAVNFVLYTITIIIISWHIGTYTITHTAIIVSILIIVHIKGPWQSLHLVAVICHSIVLYHDSWH